MKKLFLLSIMTVLGTLNVLASYIYVDGRLVNIGDGVDLYYRFINNGTELEVISGESVGEPYSYSGSVVIPSYVFYGSKRYNVTRIGDWSFGSCYDLTSVQIPETVTSIGETAFAECTALTSIDIPNSVTSIGDQAFFLCSSLTSFNIPNSLTSIGYQMFSDCYELTSIDIPNSVRTIGEEAFCNCLALTTVTIGNGVTKIGDSAFYGCPSLTSVTIGNKVSRIGDFTFGNCKALTSVTIPSNVKRIGTNAFEDCSALSSVHITDLTAWCNIDFIDMLSNPLYYAHHLFLNGEEVKDLVIPDDITSVKDNTFSGCSGLTSITIPSNVTSIGDYAFYGCSGLTSITIPSSVTSISGRAFESCGGLTSIVVESDNTVYDSRGNCNAIIESNTNTLILGCINTIIPNSVTSIGNWAFYGCSGLTILDIPNSVTSIGDGAFNNCTNLLVVSIGSGVKSIGRVAFRNCSSLYSIYCYADMVPTTDTSAFEGCYNSNVVLFVPLSAYDDYMETAPWSDFTNILGIPKCPKPTITYANGKLSFACDMEDGDYVEFVSEISDTDIGTYNDADIQLSVTYTISVYATMEGYFQSDVVTATLCWIEQQPSSEGITVDVAQVPVKPVLIQNQGDVLSIQGLDAGTPVSVYDLGGRLLGSATATAGTTQVSCTGNEKVVVVKFGEQSVKVARK